VRSRLSHNLFEIRSLSTQDRASLSVRESSRRGLTAINKHSSSVPRIAAMPAVYQACPEQALRLEVVQTLAFPATKVLAVAAVTMKF
jgi:hypothetical protein